ncbi:exopolysaccharide biosynthesis protein [Rhodobacterales bacterium HKCCE3408]|nr:exopolysaccharide biosynthesis protein [Rhodobacterales bacterium HKCCE3408]
MEKLQHALQKAREQRGGATAGPRPVSGRAAAPLALAELWAALPAYEPQPKLLIHNRVVTFESGPAATSFDVLRTKMLLMMRKNGWRRLAITSPTSACGKTTTACNLALGLSRQPDLRAIVVELDLRRPAMATLLGTEPARDVTTMLTGEASFAEQALRVRDNVAISMARRPSSDPTKYMLSNETQERLKEIEARYRPDLMIFDLPPLLVGDDTRAFLSNVDCAMLVARADKTTVAQIDTAEKEIAEQTNVLGVVLNQCRHNDEASGYYGEDEY